MGWAIACRPAGNLQCCNAAMLRPGTLRDIAAASWRAQVSRGFEPRSLDSESRVLTVTPRDQLHLMQPRWHTAAQPCTGPATSTCRAWRPRRHCPCPPAGWDACRGWMQMAGPWPTAVAAWPTGRLRSRSCGHGPVNQSGRHGAGTRLETRPPGPEQGRSRADLSRDRWIQSPEC